MNKKVFRNLSYGVYVVSTLDGTRPTGCTANSVMQITSEPASIAISINHDNYTNGCIAKTGTFAVSILSEDSDPGLIGTFGFQSGKDVDKFDGTARRLLRLYRLPRHRQNGNVHSHRIFRRSHRRRRIRDRSRHDLRLLSQRDQRQEPQKRALLSSGRRRGRAFGPLGVQRLRIRV